ncbi:MAG: hypothetical protein HY319_20480 [Armatimonadetes bacterium]|nr:hypothetical protein [Armatimonadota bacterium]
MGWTSYDDSGGDASRGWPGLGASSDGSGSPPPLPDRVLLDLETPLEQFCTGLGCLGAIAATVFGFQALSEGFTYFPVLLAVVAVSAAGLYTRSQVDNYYIVDRRLRQILFRRKVFGYEREIPVLSFSDLHAVAVDGRYQSQKSGSYWEYAVLLVGRGRRRIQVTDYFKEGYHQAVQSGRTAAEALELELVEGEPEKVLRISSGPGGKPVLQYVNRFPWEAVLIGGIVLLFLMALLFSN